MSDQSEVQTCAECDSAELTFCDWPFNAVYLYGCNECGHLEPAD